MEKQKKKNNFINLVLFGNGAIGKTAIFQRYIKDIFLNIFISTLGIDTQIKNVKMENGEIIKVKVTDTPGQENFNSLLNCLKNAQGIIIIYDVTDKKSFEYANEWINNIKNGLSFNTQLLLAGNKIDLEEGREVQKPEKILISFLIG